jgi:YHS domain-containing protein
MSEQYRRAECRRYDLNHRRGRACQVAARDIRQGWAIGAFQSKVAAAFSHSPLLGAPMSMKQVRVLASTISFICALALGIMVSGAAIAAKPEVYTRPFSNLAVDGYDTVAYFTQGSPAKGAKDFEFEYKGAIWRFSSADNLEKFKAEPAAYAPQYGGYCAWAIAQGYTARGNPQNWTIYDGKLYLNYNDKIQADWLKDVPGFIAKADANWSSVLE